MSAKNQPGTHSAFKEAKRPLKPWEVAAQEMARKTERLRALRIAKEATDREAKALKPPRAPKAARPTE